MPTLVIALRATLVTLVFTGLLYPLSLTGLAQLLFPLRANGSVIINEQGQEVGSEWMGQRFVQAGYFQPRPSAAGDMGYDAMASGGSNFGPTSAKLQARVTAEAARLRAENPEAPGTVPAELLSASGSGLDPHLSPEAALWQVARVSRARGVSPERIRRLLQTRIEGRTLGFLGEPRVNVLELNLALDRQLGRLLPSAAAK